MISRFPVSPRGLVPQVALLALLSCFTAPLHAEEGPGNYPDDPFAHDRVPLEPTEIGSGRGQSHLFALASLVDGNNSDRVYFGGQLGIEFQLHEFGGIRLSGFQELVDGDGNQLAHKFTSLRVGPALHLRPYRRLDLGVYSEAGLLLVDAVDGEFSVTAPETTLGGFISIHLDSRVYVQLELEHVSSNAEVDGVLGEQDRTAAKLGLGLVF